MNLRWHTLLRDSRANGPGRRVVLWMQGCSLGCEGCWNPELQPVTGGKLTPPAELARQIIQTAAGMDGLTLSGGEPLDQAEALQELLRIIRAETTLNVLLFSGYDLQEIRSNPARESCLRWVDAVICGRYDCRQKPAQERFCSSENQQIWLISDYFKEKDFADLPQAEWFIDADGRVIQSGIGRTEGTLCCKP